MEDLLCQISSLVKYSGNASGLDVSDKLDKQVYALDFLDGMHCFKRHFICFISYSPYCNKHIN